MTRTQIYGELLNDKQIPDQDVQSKSMAKEVAEKLESKIKRAICPYCDNVKWYIINDVDQHPVLMLRNLSSFPTYTLSCTNCGFIRQHLSIVVDGLVTGETEFFVPNGTV